LEDILNIPLIKEGRDAYKTLGKDPSRYRLACESLLRRLVKGKGLYLINNLVDAGNVLSILTRRSVAVLDYDKIEGDVEIRIGTAEDEYYGIGRGKINVADIPVYVDAVGPFGSTTSDTERTAVSGETKRILLFVICFSGSEMEDQEELAKELFSKYGNAKNIERVKVWKEC
jgi:DNA/RNA-binding domain of Phe-tRNA-synthetase-like protein